MYQWSLLPTNFVSLPATINHFVRLFWYCRSEETFVVPLHYSKQVFGLVILHLFPKILPINIKLHDINLIVD